MSEVVKLDPAARSRSGQPQAARKRSKTALVLGGGGFTGGVYEIGALRALDLLAVNQTVNEFDVYVGTSAGAFISSLTANGVTPEEMMRVLNRHLASPLRDIDLEMLLRPNYKGIATRGARSRSGSPGSPARLPGTSARSRSIDLLTGLASGASQRLLQGEGIARYVEEVLTDPDRTNDFRLLERELYLTATDLDTTERIVLGEGEWADVPISQAVAASGALPWSTSRSDRRPRVHRRRHPLDHERRRRR